MLLHLSRTHIIPSRRALYTFTHADSKHTFTAEYTAVCSACDEVLYSTQIRKVHLFAQLVNRADLSSLYSLHCVKQSVKIHLVLIVAALRTPCVIFIRPSSTFKKSHTDVFECFSPLTTYYAYISKAYLVFFLLF